MNKLILALAFAMATVSFTSTVQASNWFGGGYNQAPYGYSMPRSDYGYPNMPIMPAIPVQ